MANAIGEVLEHGIRSFRRFLMSFSKRRTHYGSRKLWISSKRGFFEGLEFEDVVYIAAADHYLKIYMIGGAIHVVKSSLKEFYNRHLSKHESFYRLSRSYVINLDMAHKIENNQLFLKENIILTIPQKRKEEMLLRMGVKD